jgi:hypothetical protein
MVAGDPAVSPTVTYGHGSAPPSFGLPWQVLGPAWLPLTQEARPEQLKNHQESLIFSSMILFSH